jgi:hypothetical protein
LKKETHVNDLDAVAQWGSPQAPARVCDGQFDFAIGCDEDLIAALIERIEVKVATHAEGDFDVPNGVRIVETRELVPDAFRVCVAECYDETGSLPTIRRFAVKGIDAVVTLLDIEFPSKVAVYDVETA